MSEQFLFSDSTYLEVLYEQYLRDPNSVDESWRKFFSNNKDQNSTSLESTNLNLEKDTNTKNAIITLLREYGHFLSNLDPLNIESSNEKNEILTELNNLQKYTNAQDQENISKLVNLYSTSLGIETNHIASKEKKEWIYNKFEGERNLLNKENKKHFARLLCEIESFEQYVHTKFPGAKRFSSEGGEAAVAAIKYISDLAAESVVEEMLIAMAHRGRLATLTNVLNKPYHIVFSEFQGKHVEGICGDVKYHMGYNNEKDISGKKVKLSLLCNPSHLESVNPVLAGMIRAKQDELKNATRDKVLGVLVHGDAAFAGQGIVAESIAMNVLEAYHAGGIIHIVINNQIGFTANAAQTRAGRYCTSFAKLAEIPIIHVNGNDIESVIFATKIAFEYQRKFNSDIVIDIICYRKYGHNEGDEPNFTQPLMYNIIKTKSSAAEEYFAKLLQENEITKEETIEIKNQIKTKLDNEFEIASSYDPGRIENKEVNSTITTGVNADKLKSLGDKIFNLPKEFNVNSKIARLMQQRLESIKNNAIDWGAAEALAFGSILEEKIPIRFTGQDVERGTFSHRHAVVYDQKDNSKYIPLNNIEKDAGQIEIANSLLSEFGVLGFEYGYSVAKCMSNSKGLTIWEAQFGDFANGAQTIFDQYISAGEAKWQQLSNLIVLLPHGYEGQGPEHSSARLERFLQLAAEDNIQVVVPTTPASYFHMLRRQLYVNKPLIVMSPKSLLRHKEAVSSISDMSSDSKLEEIIKDNYVDKDKAERVILCSGKVYYELHDLRVKSGIQNIAIIRLEQLYPFDKSKVQDALKEYINAKTYLWCQEEPENMGAWSFVKLNMLDICDLKYAGRAVSSSPATGYLNHHTMEQEHLLKSALEIVK